MQAVGVLSSAYTSGWLVDRVGARPVLGLMALFPLLMCATAFLIRERRRSSDDPELHVVVPPGAPDLALCLIWRNASFGLLPVLA